MNQKNNPKPTNRIHLAVAGVLFVGICLLAQTARATLLFSEEYPTAYGDGTALGTGTTTGGYNTKWPFGNSTGTGNPICTSAGALSYAPLAPISGSSSYGFRCATSTTRDASAEFADQLGEGNSVYCSFLVKVTAATPTARTLVGLRNSTGSGNLAAAVGISASRQLTMIKSSAVQGTHSTVLNQNETYLVVLRYTFHAGSNNDDVAMWLNPVTGQPNESGAGVTPLTTLTGNDQNNIKSVRLPSAVDASGALYLDEIRVGTTWAEVTPASGPLIGEKLGFTAQPANAAVSATMSAVVVQVQNASGVNVPSNNVPVTLTLTSGSGTLGGTLTQNTDASGKATFSNLTIDTVGTGKQLTAAASGIGAGLAEASSATFTITSGVGGGNTPLFTSSVMLPAGFKVQGTNSGAGVFTQILGATRPDEAATNWVLVNFQNADGAGRTTFTNPVSAAMPNAVYRLRIGDVTTKLQPPAIGIPPQSLIVSTGSPASFSVTATGPMLQYLWFFNGNPIPGATNSSINIASAQPAHIGNYYVAVANPAGNVNSAVATLGLGNVAPIINSQPQNQTNNAGGTAIFTVAAIGTMPLSYQWYYNNSTPLLGHTGTQLLLSNITTNDAGNYRCLVTNAFGTTNSANAYLAVNPVPTDLPDTNLIGWAAFAGVTGGAGGSETTVSTYAALRAACRVAGPLIIRVDGILVPNEDYCYIEGYDKTIVGVGTNSGLAYAGFRVSGTNIIIANLSFNSTNDNSDGVTIDDSSHGTGRNVWVDHCTFYDCTDGSVDVTKGADYVTVSWCKFYYAPVPAGVVTHEFVNLLGSSDSDDGANYHVTFHHNWYGEYCRERMPSVRFGRTHVFNNYYDCVGNNYCVRTRINAEVLVENNYFLGVQNPWERFVTSGNAGLLKATGNITNNCTFVNGWVSGAVVIPGNDTLGAELNPPPYTQSPFYYPPLTPASDVPYYVQTYAGHGKYPYAP